MKGKEEMYFVKPDDIQLSPYQIQNAKKIFDLFDDSKTGEISREGLVEAFKRFGKILSQDELNVFFKEFDTDHSNTIDFDEYLKVVTYQLANISTVLSENITFN